MNAHYTPFSILRTGFAFGTKLTVTTDKKLLPKDLRNKGMLGATVKFLKLIGSQVSVKYMGTNHFIPLEAVLSYKNYTVASKPIVSDTLFIVISKHQLFEVGTVFQTSLLRDGQRLGFYDDRGRLCILDDSIQSLSQPIIVNNTTVELDRLSNKFAVKPEQTKKIEPVSEVIGIEGVGLVQVDTTKVETVEVTHPKPKTSKTVKKSLMKDDSTVKSNSVLTDFVNVDTTSFDAVNKTIDDIANEIEGEFTDIKGYKHTSLIACLKANQIFTDLLYLDLVKSTIQGEIDSRK